MPNSRKRLAKARAALDAGNVALAINTIERTGNYTKDPDAVYLLALCQAISQNYPVAESLFNRVLELAPASAAVYGNLGLAQLHQGKLRDSIQSFLSSIRLDPAYYDAIRNLAVVQAHIRDYPNAIRHAELARKLRTDDPVVLNILAGWQQSQGNTQAAVELFSQSLAINPNQPDVYSSLAQAYAAANDYESAEKLLLQCEQRFPQIKTYNILLGNFYESRNRYQDALNQYNRILDADASNLVAVAGRARVLIALGQIDSATRLLYEHHETHNGSPEITIELCNSLVLQKQYEQAYQIIGKYLAATRSRQLSPGIAIAHASACRHTGRLDESKSTLLAALQYQGLADDIRETLYFSLGDTLDGMHQYEDAFRSYQKANEALKRTSDIDYYVSTLSDIMNTLSKETLASIGNSENETSLPVFIVGMPRSGTSLVEQILSSHPDVYGGGELTDLWSIGNEISGAMNLVNYAGKLAGIQQEKLAALADRYLSRVAALSNGEPRVTDKLPHNFMHLGLIQLLFPNAAVIHCERHPFDTCLSIYFRKFNDNHVYAKSLKQLATFYDQYRKLMAHWSENSSLRILNIKYESLVDDQETYSRKLIDHVGVEWNDAVLRYYESGRLIMTPSHHQASKPVYSSSVNRWKHYTAFLQPLIEVLGEPETYI